jgi:long-chain acyl-CoA synthetase
MGGGNGSEANVAADVDRTGDEHVLTELATREVLTAGELATRVRRMAAALHAEGVEPGDRVAILRRNSIDHVIAWYGALRAGAIAVDISLLVSDHELQHILHDVQPAVVLAEADVVGHDVLPAGTHSCPPALWADTRDEAPMAPVDAATPAVIAYTSGTTGLPKGVVHTHGAIDTQLTLLGQACGYDATWTSYVAIPLFSLHGFLPQVAATLRHGGSVLLDEKFDAPRFAAVSRQHSIQYTTLSPPMLPRILELDEGPDLSGIGVMSCGGGPLPPELRTAFESRFGVHLTQGYGATELLGVFVMDIEGDAPYGAVGRVYPGLEVVRILDEAGHEVARGESGEIAFARRCALLRYWNDPGDPAAAFVGGEWYPTGDIGRLDDDGFLYVLDRKKDVIIRGGFNIYSAEIERVLVEHPGVGEACVVGMPDDRVGEVPVAYVVPSGDQLDVVALRAFADERLGRLKRPEAVHVVRRDDLPRNGLGKVRKGELRAQLLAARPVSAAGDATPISI